MTGHYNDAGRRRVELDRRDDRREERPSQCMHRSPSFPTEPEIPIRGVMAGCHNPSSVRKDRLTLMAESREVNEDRR